MSSCYKCGKELTDGEVECDPFCVSEETGDFEQEADDLKAEAELVRELEASTTNAMALAKHLDTMGATAAKLVVEFENRKFLVYVKEL